MTLLHRLASLPLALLAFASFAAHAGEPCSDNFTADGNFLTGKTYKTWATFPSVRPQDAYARSYAFTVANGFTVTSADKDVGVISAVQTVSYGKGKTVPLNIVVSADPSGGTRVAMVYALSGGLLSPEDAIRRHFCLNMAAVGASTAAPATLGAAPPAAGDGRNAPAPSAPAPRQMRGFAVATPEQQSAIALELTRNLPAGPIKAAEAEAESAIKEFVERLACLNDYSGNSALNAYAAPGVTLSSMMSPPMNRMRYHAKSSCASVTRVQGWSAPARNALRFEVVYTADDSGEVVKVNQEWVRQPDGSWLATTVY